MRDARETLHDVVQILLKFPQPALVETVRLARFQSDLAHAVRVALTQLSRREMLQVGPNRRGRPEPAAPISD